MRRVRYSVAMSLDGHIAGPAGEFDWIPQDPAVDFGAFFATIDTVLMGRHTFDVVRRQPAGPMTGMRRYVFSRTLDPARFPDVSIVRGDVGAVIERLRAEDGKDIWLMGGGVLFQSLLDIGAVDTVEIGPVPVLLGRGIPLLPVTDHSTQLSLAKTETFPSGIVLLKYDVVDSSPG